MGGLPATSVVSILLLEGASSELISLAQEVCDICSGDVLLLAPRLLDEFCMGGVATNWYGLACTWMSTGPSDHDVVELSIALGNLQIAVRGPAGSAADFVRQVADTPLASQPVSVAGSPRVGIGTSSLPFASPSRVSQASSTGSETRTSIAGSFPLCPSSWLATANSRLRGSNLSATERANRAWIAGCWARAVLDGRVSSPNSTPTIELRNGFWVVVRCASCTTPRIFTSSGKFFEAVGALEGSGTICQAFPSETEARIYLAAVGLEVEAFN
eukprot:s1495_g12.t1